MKKTVLILTAGLTLAAAGCKPKPKPITPAARAEAAQNASEGDFAVQIRDYPRAEGLFAKAVELDPESPRYWKQLGAIRVHTGDKKGARNAYEHALDLARKEYLRTNKQSIGAALGEVETHVLLGNTEEARKTLARLAKDHPDDLQVRAFVDNNILDHMLADETIKASIVH